MKRQVFAVHWASKLAAVVLGCVLAGTMAFAQGGMNSCDIDNGLVVVTKSVPREASLNQEYVVSMVVKATQQVANVVVTDTVPEGAVFVKSDPQAQRSGNKLTWTMDKLAAGDSATITVTLRPQNEGDLSSCTTVSAVPECCVATVVGRPVIEITKDGPETALLGSDVTYNVVVTNTGSAVAKDVVVTDRVPAGLTHASGEKALTFNVGDLAPNQSERIPLTLKAANPGRHCNVAVANSSNAGTVQDDACTTVVEQKLEIVKTGLKKQYLGKTAGYTIVVSNPGDVDLTNVVVTDSAPAATRIVEAPGATVTGNTAKWQLATLKAGAKQTYEMTLTSKAEGTHCNNVSVATAEGLTDSAQACTLWEGYPAILIEVIDTEDPLLIGEETTYVIRVTNQGTADDTNVAIKAKFPAQISPVSCSGDTAGTVQGKMVPFKAYPVLKPKQAIEWQIKAKAVQQGDSRLFVELTSDLLKKPVTEEESTHVY